MLLLVRINNTKDIVPFGSCNEADMKFCAP